MNFVGKFERLSPLTNLTNNEWRNSSNKCHSFGKFKRTSTFVKGSTNPKVIFLINDESLIGKPYQNFNILIMKKVIGEIFMRRIND